MWFKGKTLNHYLNNKTMKYKIFIITIISILNNAFAQKVGLVNYGYIEALGIGDAKGMDSNSYLLFNNEMSYYVTAKDSLEDSNPKEKSFTKGGSTSIYTGFKTSPQGDQVVFNTKKNTVWSNLYYGKQIYVKEIATKINWKIEKESKKIGKYSCKKATANFRGRDYIAWFTSEIALQFGPWKLNGLPGLILEAYDTDKNVFWYFKNIEYPSSTLQKVKYLTVPKNQKFVSFGDFEKFQQQQMDETDDKQKIVQKSYPNVIFGKPILKNSFVECE